VIPVERMDFPPPATLFERVDLPRKRERWNRACEEKP
jgi:hypothetical protein